MIYLTEGLVETLLGFASEKDPDSTTVPLGVTDADELGLDIEQDGPIFTHFYMQNDDDAVNAVFGVDLGTPAGQSQGRFLSHPDGNPELTMRDDLHAAVLVAVPPWQPANVSAYDRDSTARHLTVINAATPDRDFEG